MSYAAFVVFLVDSVGHPLLGSPQRAALLCRCPKTLRYSYDWETMMSNADLVDLLLDFVAVGKPSLLSGSSPIRWSTLPPSGSTSLQL